MKCKLCSMVILLGMVFALPTMGFGETTTYMITIKDHRFEPQELSVPVNEKVRLIITNEDPTEEEFESYDLNREEIVDGKEEITVFIGPLALGEYSFFGEFHQETAQGIIKVIENGEGK